MLKRFSDWFDTLQEPYRFIAFVSLVFGAFIPLGFAVVTYEAGASGALQIFFIALGAAHLVLFYTVAIYRATRK